MPDPTLGLSLVGSALSAGSASSAANAQEAAAKEDLAFQRETRDLIFDRLNPWYQGGNTANEAFMYEMGLGARPMIGATAPRIRTVTTAAEGGQPAPVNSAAYGDRGEYMRAQQAAAEAGPQQTTSYRVGGQTFSTMEEAQAWADANKRGGTPYRGFRATPGYQFRVDAGTGAINALAGARGGLVSGRTLQDLSKFNQGIASEEYGNYLARLGGLGSQGLGAASGQATAATNAAQGVSNALAGIGNAQAAGAIGVGNAINSGIQNGIGMWQYQRAMAPPATSGALAPATSPRPPSNPWF